MANAKDPAAMEKAAADFSAKFPDSELRILLYKQAMRSYQAANSADKMLEEARTVLGIDPDDPEALLAAAEVLAERTRDTDLDRDQRLAEARKMAQHALETVDTDLVLRPDMPPEQVKQAKGYFRSTAYFILGTLDFNNKDYKAAEANLRKSIDEYPTEPIPEAVFRLSVSLDMQDNLDEALKVADQAVQLTKEGTPVGNAARQERNRIVARKGGSSGTATPNAASPNPPKQ
jgi:tetratricopeptide (TPR) repeat protein